VALPWPWRSNLIDEDQSEWQQHSLLQRRLLKPRKTSLETLETQLQLGQGRQFGSTHHQRISERSRNLLTTVVVVVTVTRPALQLLTAFVACRFGNELGAVDVSHIAAGAYCAPIGTVGGATVNC
jgi:hypothetical protein